MENARVIQFPSERVPKPSLKPHRIKSEPSIGQMVGKGLTDATMRELSLKFAKPKSEKDLRDRIIFLLASSTGLRAKELVGLRYSNVTHSPEGDILIKYRKKGGKFGYTVISKIVFEEIENYQSQIGEKSDFFLLSLPKRKNGKRSPLSTRGLQWIVNNWGVKTASGKLIHPHALRHTVAQKTFDHFGSIATQKLLGHSSANTTSNYYTRPYFNASAVLNWS
ncbi:site-specific recombinase, phage integrase family [Leptospira ellinghausenii]|uniref:Site-specific recombinase, phage integrase family n=1 Tax=Leptospira ellinghausenii TaxID=1917822 RepID=A0A2P2DIV9_9LEPT|nr:site-specific integrase [Leptospira ellinghausenii]GBF44568.1 site-specific recombinase, phage integrase family [Leptospira ellinghausenii]